MKNRLRQLWSGLHGTTMVMTLMVWVCVLPLVLLLTGPCFGWQAALTGAVISFVAALVACYIICLFPAIAREEEPNARRPGLW